jgi:hypothetical protein
MNRQVAVQETKTISDYPLLIGEILQRSELRKLRRKKWRVLLGKVRFSDGRCQTRMLIRRLPAGCDMESPAIPKS